MGVVGVVGVIAAVCVALVGLSRPAQRAAIFPAGGSVWRTPAAQPFRWEFEDLQFTVDGCTTHAWFIPAARSRGAVLFSHGNAGTIADRLESVEVFHSLGLDVLIYDYGGYGRSTGRPSEARCYEDGRAMWRYLTETRGVAPGRIVLFGRSLGGGIATQLATETQAAGLILESSFLSTCHVAREMLPFLPARLIIRHRFDNAAKVGEAGCPVLVIHSPDDEIIPFHHGRELFELAKAPKTFLEIRGGHNEGFLVSEPEYPEGLAAFFDTVLGATAP
ncbi:MAG: alpha/beta hydrolase [Candidatus Hydrogenedentes bacterium]|nr:alpha/beta hydrolase [Candidatus Hydrogenedentota bacterium]